MNHDSKHMIFMVLACAVPMIFIALIPVFGISQNYAWIAIIAMIVFHLFLMKSHKH